MEDLIARLDAWLSRERPEFYAHLLPGLTDAALRDLETRLGRALPAEFQAFYRWRNGQDASYFESFFHNFSLMPAVHIVEAQRVLNDLLEAGDFDLPNWWSPQWVPFLYNGAGDHYCVDTGGSFGGVPGQVLMFNHDWENRDIEYPSFHAWLATVVEALEAGMFEYGEYGMQPVDDAWDALCAVRNPGYPIEHDAG
jgi:cell wall assembly regulator SMI1